MPRKIKIPVPNAQWILIQYQSLKPENKKRIENFLLFLLMEQKQGFRVSESVMMKAKRIVDTCFICAEMGEATGCEQEGMFYICQKAKAQVYCLIDEIEKMVVPEEEKIEEHHEKRYVECPRCCEITGFNYCRQQVIANFERMKGD